MQVSFEKMHGILIEEQQERCQSAFEVIRKGGFWSFAENEFLEMRRWHLDKLKALKTEEEMNEWLQINLRMSLSEWTAGVRELKN